MKNSAGNIGGDSFASRALKALPVLEDTQSEPDRRNIAINEVGIRDLRHPIMVEDRSGEAQPSIAVVSMSVALASHARGTHMSRFVAVLNEEVRTVSVRKVGLLPARIAERLQAEKAGISLEFPYFVTKLAPVTGTPGKVDYLCRLSANLDEITTSVQVPLTTLCPCSRNISDRGAHNQRGRVTLRLSSSQPPFLEEMIELVESCGSASVFSLLKRPDEKHVTELAYDNPVFVEDLVRNVAQRLKKLEGLISYRIEAENFESIHNHNAYAVIEG